jgi:hypothetical protein
MLSGVSKPSGAAERHITRYILGHPRFDYGTDKHRPSAQRKKLFIPCVRAVKNHKGEEK